MSSYREFNNDNVIAVTPIENLPYVSDPISPRIYRDTIVSDPIVIPPSPPPPVVTPATHDAHRSLEELRHIKYILLGIAFLLFLILVLRK